MAKRKGATTSDDVGGIILEAASTVFTRDGFEAARVDEIARLAGVAKGSVYNHFADKEELFYSVVAKEVDDLNRNVAELAGAAGNLPFPDFTRRLVGGLFERMLLRRGAAMVVLSDSWGRLRDDLRRRIIERLRGHLMFITDHIALRAGIHGVALRKPELVANAILGLTFIFAQRQMLLAELGDSGPGESANDLIRFIGDMVLSAVDRPPEPAAGD